MSCKYHSYSHAEHEHRSRKRTAEELNKITEDSIRHGAVKIVCTEPLIRVDEDHVDDGEELHRIYFKKATVSILSHITDPVSVSIFT